MHAEEAHERLGIAREIGSRCLVNDLAGLQHVDAIGDRERAVEILLDQQDGEPLRFAASR